MTAKLLMQCLRSFSTSRPVGPNQELPELNILAPMPSVSKQAEFFLYQNERMVWRKTGTKTLKNSTPKPTFPASFQSYDKFGDRLTVGKHGFQLFKEVQPTEWKRKQIVADRRIEDRVSELYHRRMFELSFRLLSC